MYILLASIYFFTGGATASTNTYGTMARDVVIPKSTFIGFRLGEAAVNLFTVVVSELKLKVFVVSLKVDDELPYWLFWPPLLSGPSNFYKIMAWSNWFE
jgi:hypothetical protein